MGACCDDCAKSGGCCAEEKALAKAKKAKKNSGAIVRTSLVGPHYRRASATPRVNGSWPAGQLVKFVPNPASFALYRVAPHVGATGVVVSVPLGGGRRSTTMPGPGGGLVYVRWTDGSVMGVAPGDLQKIKPRASKRDLAKKNPAALPSGRSTGRTVGIAAAGAALGILIGSVAARGSRR